MRRFSLLAFSLCLLGSLIYGNKITVILEPTKTDTGWMIKVPHDYERASLFIELQGDIREPLFLKSKPEYEGFSALVQPSDNRKNFRILDKHHYLKAGEISITTSYGIVVKAFRIEYRRSALSYYWEGIRSGHGFAIGIFGFWIFGVLLGLWVWRNGLTLLGSLSTFCLHLVFLWLIFPPLTGNDDTLHIPAAMKLITRQSSEQIRKSVVQLIKDSKYLELRNTEIDVRKEAHALEDYCPHKLAFPTLTTENCNFDDNFFLRQYMRLGRMFALEAPKEFDIFIKVLNQIVLVFGAIFLALTFSPLFQRNFGISLTFSIAGVLSVLPLVPQTMTSSQELCLFTLGALQIWVLSRVAIFPMRIMTTLIFGLSLAILFIPFGGVDLINYKLYILVIIPAVTVIVGVFRLIQMIKARRRINYGFIDVCVVAASVVAVNRISLTETLTHFWKYGLYQIVHYTNANLNALTVPKVFEHAIFHFVGTIKGGIEFPPSPVKGVVLFIYLLFIYFGTKAVYRRNRVLAVCFLGLTVVSISIMICLGLFTLDPTWIHLRFAYALVGAFSILASAGIYTRRELQLAPLLFTLVAVNTLYLPGFILPLN